MRKNEAGLYEEQIDGKRYEFEKWGADESLEVLIDITSLVGGPLGAAISKAFVGGSGLSEEIDANMLGTVFEQLMSNFKKDIVKPLIKKLCSEKVLCNGRPVNFNAHYKEDLFHMFKVTKTALEVQYGNFFDAVKEAVGFRKAVVSIPA